MGNLSSSETTILLERGATYNFVVSIKAIIHNQFNLSVLNDSFFLQFKQYDI